MNTPTELRSEQAQQADQINAIAGESNVQQSPTLAAHETVKETHASLEEIVIPAEPADDEPDFEDDESEAEEQSDETVVRIVPTATVYFRAQDSALQQTLVSVRKHTDSEGMQFDLCNPIASGKRKGKPAGAVGILRQPVAEFFKYLGTVINQNVVFLGARENCEEYMDRLFVRVENRLAELLYGAEPFLMGEGEDTYSIEKTELFSCSINLSTEQQGEEVIAYVNVAINVHVAQLLGNVDKAENVLKLYQKFLQTVFAEAGIETVNIGVVFDVEDFTETDSAAYRLFNLLVGNALAVKPQAVISKHSFSGLPHEFAFQQNSANTLVMLDTQTPQVPKV